MAERGTPPIQLTLQIPEGATASINITSTQTPESPNRTLSRGTRVTVAKNYPHEPAIQPSLIQELLQNLKEKGPDHTDTDRSFILLDEAIDQAARRGFFYETYLEDIESILGETRVNYEGNRLAKEPDRVAELRQRLTEIGLERLPSRV